MPRKPRSPPPDYLLQWGSGGEGDGQFREPQGIATDASGAVYVVDSNNNRVQKFDAAGNLKLQWGSQGSGDRQFDYPSGIATNSAGDVYVTDINNSRVQKFDSNGGFITKWGSGGEGDGQLWWPSGIATDASGDVYVADTINNRVQKFDSNGGFITKWGSQGSGDGQFYNPYGPGIATDASGDVYVIDRLNNRIQKFTAVGDYLLQWGSGGEGDGQFREPQGIATDASGNVYVADTINNRIQKFGGGPVYQIAEVQDSLDAIIENTGTDPALAEELVDAKESLEDANTALESNPPNRQAALQNIEQAMSVIQPAVDNGSLDATQGNRIMDDLAKIARQITLDAIEEAQDREGAHQTSVAEAQAALEQGDVLRDSKEFTKAVDMYKEGCAGQG